MVDLLRIFRSFDWIPTALEANRDQNPIPEGYFDGIMPTVEIFGTQRAREINIETVTGTVASLEEVHSKVPVGRVRHYLSMSYVHDDPISRFLLPGRVIQTDVGFPFAGFRDQLEMPPNVNFAVRNITVGPNHRIAVRTNAMGGAAKMSLTVTWVEFPLGEWDRME